MQLHFYTPICDKRLDYIVYIRSVGQLYKLLVSKICMQCYIVPMTMNIIIIFIKIDKNVATTWSPMYCEYIQHSVYAKYHFYFVYMIDVATYIKC